MGGEGIERLENIGSIDNIERLEIIESLYCIERIDSLKAMLPGRESMAGCPLTAG